jgi:tetratricopeptide (TPR) repeat protein
MTPLHRLAGSRHHGYRRRKRWPILLALAAAAGLLALFVSSRNPTLVRHDTGEFTAGAESLKAAAGRRDWADAEASAERLAAEQPRNSEALCQLALALHNRTTMVTPRFNRPHPPLRLSLDRIAAEMRVLALLDSAVRLALTPEQAARAQMLRGMAFESLGLPIEALECYRAANERAPRLERARLNLRRLTTRLADPRLPDSLADLGPARGGP